jgi:deoxyadenosine/deoxycytidine kinase
MTRFIAVAGGIGAGKSSLSSFLQRHFGLLPFYEGNDDNPFLQDFYSDMGRFAFPSQVWFLTRKYRAHLEIGSLDRAAVLDRTIYEDAEIFAPFLYRNNWMSDREHETYVALYETIKGTLPPPDLLVYLRTTVRTQKKRIALRGRAMERRIDTPYLQRINRLYRQWIGRWDRSPVLTLDADRLDFIADLADQADLLSTIRGYLPGGR